MRNPILQRVLDETPQDIQIFVDWYADLVLRIDEIMREKGINRKNLAEKLDKKPSEISKWLNSEHNFTLRSLARLSAELGEPLLEVPRRNPQATFIPGASNRIRQFVTSGKNAPEKKPLIINWQPYNQPNPLSNVG